MSAALRRILKPTFFSARRHLSTLSAVAAKPSPQPLSPKAISSAKNGIRSSSDADLIVAHFESAAHEPSFYGDRTIYRLAVNRLVHRGRHDLVERILEHSKSDPAAPKSEGFLVRILTLYSVAGMVDHAVRTFEAMPGLGCRRSERSLCALLSAFVDNRRFDLLKETFSRALEELDIAPGIASYNILMKGLISNGEFEKARSLLDEMPQKGVEPDITCYNTVLSECLSKGDESGFEEILRLINKKGLAPNKTTFNCRIAAHCKKGNSFQAKELLAVMAVKGIRPNHITFDTLVSGFCKEGNVVAAMDVFEIMKGEKSSGDSGRSLISETYVLLLQGLLEKGELGKAVEICKQSLDGKLVPAFGVVRRLVDGLVKSSRGDEVKDIAARMRKAVKGDAVVAWKKIEEEFSL